MEQLQIGDIVEVTNGYGVILRGYRTITGIDNRDGWHDKKVKRYFISPTDTPWYSFPETRLRLVLKEGLFLTQKELG